MSDSDSFIEEVSEELRRDRLFAFFRRYGWIAISIVVLIVAAAAYREYAAAQKIAQAEALGDAVAAAIETETAEARAQALSEVDAEGTAKAAIDLLAAAALVEADDPAKAAEMYQAIAVQADIGRRYTDLAALKAVMLQSGDDDPQARMAMLTGLAQPGAPYRVLAEEQMALIEVEMGDAEAANARLQRLLQDQEATAGLRRRASDVIVALGYTPGT